MFLTSTEKALLTQSKRPLGQPLLPGTDVHVYSQAVATITFITAVLSLQNLWMEVAESSRVCLRCA